MRIVITGNLFSSLLQKNGIEFLFLFCTTYDYGAN